MACPDSIQLGNTIPFGATTRNPTTKVAADADALPTYSVYEGTDDSPMSVALTDVEMSLLNDDNTTGAYKSSIDATTAAGFEAGKSYRILVTATVDSVSDNKEFWFRVTGSGVSSTVTVTPTTGTTAGDIDLLTFYDAIQHVKDSDFGIGDDQNLRSTKRAVRKAYESTLQQCNWKYLWSEWQLNIIDSDSLTVEYDHTGHGDGDRMVTAATGTLPTELSTNPTDFRLKVSTNIYSVDQYVDADQFTLTSNQNPGSDITTATTATLYRNAYPLPDDFRNTGTLISPNSYWNSCYRPRQHVSVAERVVGLSGGPFYWSIIKDRNPGRPGGYAIYLVGYPTSDEKLHLWYKTGGKKPRLTGLETKASVGTISVSGTTVTGTSTTFSSDMEGAILFIGDDGTTVPTDVMGDEPPAEQHRIRSVTNTTSLQLYTTASTVAVGSEVKYRVSDIIDFHPSMHEAFLSGCLHCYCKLVRDEKNQKVTAWNYRNEVLDSMQEQVTYRGPRGPVWGWTSLSLDEPSELSEFGTETTT